MILSNKHLDIINSFQGVPKKGFDSAMSKKIYKEGQQVQCYFCHSFKGTEQMTEEVFDCCLDCDFKIQNKL